jgi:Reverse transcriptase (RNA-dependent DNA polymerase)
LESPELGVLFSAAGACRLHTQEVWGERILGVPTVADRVAQMVVKQHIEPDLDPIFLADSYGYRPKKAALDAIGVTRQRCWKYNWVLEFDIKGLFAQRHVSEHQVWLSRVLLSDPAGSKLAGQHIVLQL